MSKKYYSEAAMVIHESVKDLFEIGAISEAEMRDFDERCIVEKSKTTHKTESPRRVLKTREESKVRGER